MLQDISATFNVNVLAVQLSNKMLLLNFTALIFYAQMLKDLYACQLSLKLELMYASSILVYHFLQHAELFGSTWMTSRMHIKKREG